MKKIAFPVILFNGLFTVSIIIFLSFTKFQLANYDMPYGLGEQARSFSVTERMDSPGPIDHDRLENLSKLIYSTIKDEKVVLICKSIDQIGLGVYDSRGKYLLPNKRTKLNTVLSKNAILVKKSSYYENSAKIKSLTGKTMETQGSYPADYVLFDPGHDYIYNFFYDPYLVGDFFIECAHTKVIENLVQVFEKNGFNVVYQSFYHFTLKQKLLNIASNASYFITCIGFICMIVNFLSFYFSLFEGYKRKMDIHIRYGATKTAIFMRYFFRNLFSIGFAVLCGAGVYIGIFRNSPFMLSSGFLFFASFISYLLCMVLFSISLLWATFHMQYQVE